MHNDSMTLRNTIMWIWLHFVYILTKRYGTLNIFKVSIQFILGDLLKYNSRFSLYTCCSHSGSVDDSD